MVVIPVDENEKQNDDARMSTTLFDPFDNDQKTGMTKREVVSVVSDICPFAVIFRIFYPSK